MESINYASLNAVHIARLAKIVQEYTPNLTIHAAKLRIDEETALGLMHDAYIKVMARLAREEFVETGGGLRGFYTTSFMNACLDVYRKRRFELQMNVDDNGKCIDHPSRDTPLVEMIATREIAEIVREEVAKLENDNYRNSIMRSLEDLPLGGSTQRSYAFKARKKLREELLFLEKDISS